MIKFIKAKDFIIFRENLLIGQIDLKFKTIEIFSHSIPSNDFLTFEEFEEVIKFMEKLDA